MRHAIQSVGLATENRNTTNLVYDVAVATRRCILCSSGAECQSWSKTGFGEAEAHWCPNSTYFATLTGAPSGNRHSGAVSN
ncbi:MAG: DUF6455 family protein [Burkholderiales bacterium]